MSVDHSCLPRQPLPDKITNILIEGSDLNTFLCAALTHPGKAGVVCLPVGHGGGGVRRPDRRRLHADGGRKQHEHQGLRHGPAARQSLQGPLLPEVCLTHAELYRGGHAWSQRF